MIENDSPKIFEGTVKISKRVFSLYKSKIHENGLLYKGNVFIENNHIRLNYSAYNMQNRLHGYWLSYDSENYISLVLLFYLKKE